MLCCARQAEACEAWCSARQAEACEARFGNLVKGKTRFQFEPPRPHLREGCNGIRWLDQVVGSGDWIILPRPLGGFSVQTVEFTEQVRREPATPSMEEDNVDMMLGGVKICWAFKVMKFAFDYKIIDHDPARTSLRDRDVVLSLLLDEKKYD